MSFKYQEDMKTLSCQCPPSDYKPLDIDAYRWVFDDITDKRNFTPQFRSQPKRFNNSNHTDEEKCSFMSISMFINQDYAKKRFSFLLKTTGTKAYKFFGTKIAHKKLEPNDGLNQNSDKNGHFNHHPNSHVNYENQFKIVGDIS